MNEYIVNDAKVILAYVLKNQAGLSLLNANSTTNNLDIMYLIPVYSVHQSHTHNSFINGHLYTDY